MKLMKNGTTHHDTTYLKDEIYSWEDEGLEKRKSKIWKKTMKELHSQTTEQ